MTFFNNSASGVPDGLFFCRPASLRQPIQPRPGADRGGVCIPPAPPQHWDPGHAGSVLPSGRDLDRQGGVGSRGGTSVQLNVNFRNSRSFACPG